jgi:hypothetical protein
VNIVEDAVLGHHLCACNARRAADGVPGVRAAHASRRLLVGQLLARDNAGERVPVGNAFSHDHDVGLEAWRDRLDGKVRTAPTESGLHLVDDEHDAFAVADAL